VVRTAGFHPANWGPIPHGVTMVKFIYFDVGGVVIQDFSDSNKGMLMRRFLGITPDQDAAYDAARKLMEDQLCTGMDIEQGYTQLLAQFQLKLPTNTTILDYFVNHFEPNRALWPVLAELKQRCRVGLLTNMYAGGMAALAAKGLLPSVAWDVIVDSSVVQLRKPLPEIYTEAQRQAGVPADQILFVDNLLINIEGAQQAGWQTHWYDSSNYPAATYTLSNFLAKLPLAEFQP
jgi:HAD superfamily hydrolase (TIGR01509 family)